MKGSVKENRKKKKEELIGPDLLIGKGGSRVVVMETPSTGTPVKVSGRHFNRD